MENNGLNVIQHAQCDNLRWKGMFVDSDADPAGEGHIFWCVKTQIALGPDGEMVDHSACGPARTCYKPL